MLLSLLSFALPLAASLPNPSQQPFQLIADDLPPDLSAELFRSVHGLLKSWSQAFQPIGRNAVPAIIPAGTLLYHGRGDARPPTSGLDWFALDAEHAYMFASHGSNSTFNTYVATSPLKVLYFDGFSASKGDPGSQDLQKLVAFGSVSVPGSGGRQPRFEDSKIAEGLCKWGSAHGINGFVREEATFEVIWCDFSQDVKLLHSVNTTRPGTSMPGYPDQPGYPDHRHPPPPHATYSYSTIETPASDVGDAERLPPAGPMGASPWQMLNAASWHYSARDVRVKPSVSHLTSLTDPEYTSLWPIYELPVHERRLSNLSNEDLKTFIGRLENNIKHWHEPDNQNKDYLGIVDVIVDRTAGRLARMQARLESETPSETIERIEAEAFDILFPYLDIPRTMGGNGERPDARTRHEAIEQALKSCSHAYTGNWQIRSESSADNVLSNAIEGVLHRICAVSGSILEESLSMQVRSMSDGMRVRYQLKTAERWQRRINNLVEWLDWPVWKTCKNACSSDEICYMPMWPIHMGNTESPPGGPGYPRPGLPEKSRPIKEPRCVKRS